MTTSHAQTGLDYERIYRYRFKDVDQTKKDSIWSAIADWIWRAMGEPQCLLDPASGSMEFLRFAGAKEKWGVDMQRPDPALLAAAGAQFIHSNIFAAELPAGKFDGVFMSNFLEHLASPEEIHALLRKLHGAMRPGGVVAIMGPNFKYCAKDYFDCADHKLILTHVSVEELLYSAGFTIKRTYPRFLPYSFRSRLPQSAWLVRRYLSMPLAWRVLGKQFLVFAERT